MGFFSLLRGVGRGSRLFFTPPFLSGCPDVLVSVNAALVLGDRRRGKSNQRDVSGRICWPSLRPVMPKNQPGTVRPAAYQKPIRSLSNLHARLCRQRFRFRFACFRSILVFVVSPYHISVGMGIGFNNGVQESAEDFRRELGIDCIARNAPRPTLPGSPSTSMRISGWVRRALPS